jgi:hypothetical protein
LLYQNSKEGFNNKVMKRNIFLFLLFFCLTAAYPQSSLTDDEDETEAVEDIKDNAETVKAFRGIALGMSLQKVKDVLKDDPYFNYHDDADVYILPQKEQKLIECTGNSYIKRAFFQFHDDTLYIIIIELNKDKIDFYTLLNTFSEKYGKYSAFSPDSVVWQKDNITLVLERPVTVKYIDTGVFNSLKEQGRLEESAETLSLEKFLEQF